MVDNTGILMDYTLWSSNMAGWKILGFVRYENHWFLWSIFQQAMFDYRRVNHAFWGVSVSCKRVVGENLRPSGKGGSLGSKTSTFLHLERAGKSDPKTQNVTSYGPSGSSSEVKVRVKVRSNWPPRRCSAKEFSKHLSDPTLRKPPKWCSVAMCQKWVPHLFFLSKTTKIYGPSIFPRGFPQARNPGPSTPPISRRLVRKGRSRESTSEILETSRVEDVSRGDTLWY